MSHDNNMMDNMSDSECSDTSESGTSSSASSSNSSDSEQSFQSLEPARILKQNLELPKGLCENPEIFSEFFSLDTWRCLPDHMKDQLKPFLPNFDDVCTDEKESQRESNATVQKLFTNQITRFNASPLIDFQRNLEEGNYRPDIARLRANIKKSSRREQRFQQCERISRLAKSLVVSRERALRNAYGDSAKDTNKQNSKKKTNGASTSASTSASPLKLQTSAAAARAKKRYFEEIANILEDCGLETDLTDDENYPEGPPPSLARKKRNLSGSQLGLMGTGSEPRIISTMAQKGGLHTMQPISIFKNIDAEEIYQELIRQHKERKLEDPEHLELDTSDIKISDIYARTYNTPGRKPSAKSLNAINSTSLMQIKEENELSIDHTENDLLHSINTSYDITSMDTSHINFGLSHNNSLVDKLPTISPTMNLKDVLIGSERIKTEIKEEKPETDVCKQFLKDDDFKSLDTLDLPSKKSIFGLGRMSDVKTSVSDALISSPNINTSLYVKDEDLNSTADTKYSDSLLPMASTMTTSLISMPSMTISDLKSEKSPSDKLLKNNLSCISFGDKSLKTDSFSDLDGIDIMRLPVDLDDASNMDMLDDIVVDMKPELLQETHACFLSLIRDVFCSTTDHRTTLDNLHCKISAWVENPITALNDWFGLADSWLELLASAVHFLAGDFLDQPDDFVPYIEFKTNLNIYQWIGAGRDSDQRLKQLCEYWLKRRNDMGVKPQIKDEFETSRNKHNSTVEDSFHNRVNLIDRAVSPPPPPRCPTNWIVKPADADEIVEFRRQERKRFENPHQAFTYRLHGYDSVVGPVKGIYTHIPALTKARGHNMLVTDRPSFVTILTLVRDATARLPNGEGTRTDICELLKSSQYISPTASETVLQTIVSGALDRMHTENDSCVRYDPKRKIWIYLHRNRSEEEFERMHQQFQGISKHKKQNNRKAKVKTTPTTTPKSGTVLRLPDNPIETKNIILSPPTSANLPIPIGTTPKKKITIKTIGPHAGVVSISNASLTPTSAQVQTIPATVRLSQANVLSTVTSPPVPALSSITSPILSTNPPPLINNIMTTPKGTIVKPELVPIQQIQDANIEHVEIDSTSDTTTPIIINKSPTVQNPGQITGIILDKNQAMNSKIIGKPSIAIVSAANQVGTAQIKLTTSGGIQTVHVSSGHTIIKPQQSNILQSGTQSILSANQLRTVRAQQSNTMPPLVAAQTTGNHQYVIPISIGKNTNINKTIQPIVAQSTAKIQSPKTIKTANIPVSGTKTIIRTSNAANIPPGASLISPSVVAANNIALQKQVVTSPATMQIIQAKQLQQQKIIVASSGGNVLGQNPNKATIVGTSQTGAPIVVQKIIAVSKPMTGTSNVVVTTSPGITTPNTINTTTPPGTSLINPHIIQIHQANSDKSPQTAKVQTISTANLSPLQQQSLLQRINKQIRGAGGQAVSTSQQNLILKPQQVLQTIQKSLQPTQIQLSPVKSAASLMDGQIQMVTTTSNALTAPIMSGPNVKVGSNLIQSSATATTPISAVRTVSANSPLIGKVITDQSGQIISLENLVQQKQVTVPGTVRIAGAKPGQTTNLIQLTGSPGQVTQYAVVSQGRNLISMAQPRFLTTQAISTNATSLSQSPGNIVTVSGVKASSGISVLTNSNALNKTDGVKIGQRIATISQPTIIQSNQQSGTGQTNAPKIIQSTQLQPISAQQLVNAKVLGVQGFQGLTQATQLGQRVKAGTSIRMVNASNLNIANIDGKQVIIASKTPTILQSPQQLNKSPQQQQLNRSNIVWTQQGNSLTNTGSNIIGTLPQAQVQQATGQTVMFGNQVVKIQPHQSQAKPSTSTVSVLSSTGQTIKVHAPNVITTMAGVKPNIKNVLKGTNLTAAPGQRVVLAVQGGGQILLPQNFQGGSINLKSLQGLKMIPIQQSQQTNTVQLNQQTSQIVNPTTSNTTGDS